MRTLKLLLALLIVIGTAPMALAHDDERTLRARLSGYNETPLTLSTPASGQFKAQVNSSETMITYQLSYQGLEGTVTQAHIHLGRPAITGGIVLFLCTNLAPPAGVPTPQACPTPPTTISGTLTAADVIAQTGQGIAGSADFGEVVRAIRAGATYANVHSTLRPGGEIRGPIGGGDHDD